MAQDSPQKSNTTLQSVNMTDNIPASNTTPPWVVLMVVGTLCLMCLGYMVTLCFAVINGIALDNNVFVAFTTLGGGVVGSISTILVNTRIQNNTTEKK